MEEGLNKQRKADYLEDKNNEIYSKIVRAGKRTYFFDVKSTRRNDYYITITESKRQMNDAGEFSYEKHKIFLYSEDFKKVLSQLLDVINFVNDKEGNPLFEGLGEIEEAEGLNGELHSI